MIVLVHILRCFLLAKLLMCLGTLEKENGMDGGYACMKLATYRIGVIFVLNNCKNRNIVILLFL